MSAIGAASRMATSGGNAHLPDTAPTRPVRSWPSRSANAATGESTSGPSSPESATRWSWGSTQWVNENGSRQERFQVLTLR